jgi:hypothetical protein
VSVRWKCARVRRAIVWRRGSFLRVRRRVVIAMRRQEVPSKLFRQIFFAAALEAGVRAALLEPWPPPRTTRLPSSSIRRGVSEGLAGDGDPHPLAKEESSKHPGAGRLAVNQTDKQPSLSTSKTGLNVNIPKDIGSSQAARPGILSASYNTPRASRSWSVIRCLNHRSSWEPETDPAPPSALHRHRRRAVY